MKEFCCEYMDYHANFRCDFHENTYIVINGKGMSFDNATIFKSKE